MRAAGRRLTVLGIGLLVAIFVILTMALKTGKASLSSQKLIGLKIGAQGGGWTEITNFPDDDEEVVVRGQYELKLAMPSSSGGGAKKAGHFHADGAFHESDED